MNDPTLSTKPDSKLPLELIEYARGLLAECPTLSAEDLRAQLREKFGQPADPLLAAARATTDIDSGSFVLNLLLAGLVLWPLVAVRDAFYTHPRERRKQQDEAVIRLFFPGQNREPTKEGAPFDWRLLRTLLVFLAAFVVVWLIGWGILALAGQ